MKNVWSFCRAMLFYWGIVSLLGLLGGSLYVAYNIGVESLEHVDTLSPDEAAFVLNGCGLGAERLEQLVHSYVSPRAFTGDYLDVYAMKLKNIDIAELTKTPEINDTGPWFRGDHLPPVIADAVYFAADLAPSDTRPWFPSAESLMSSEVYVYPKGLYLNGVSVAAAKLIFVRPADKMVFYVSAKL